MLAKHTLLALALVVTGLVSLCPATSHAGLNADWASCHRNQDGSGGCQGTLDGFRTHADPNAQANFHASDYYPASYFSAYLDGQNYFCAAYNNTYPRVSAFWQNAMTAHGFFAIYWDTAGNCSYLSVANVSYSR